VLPGQISRAIAGWSREVIRLSSIVLLSIAVPLAALSFVGCQPKTEPAAKPAGNGRDFFEQTIKEFHHPAAEARGAERERLLNATAVRYEQLLSTHREESDLCAQALLGLGNIRALQGRTNEAVQLYASVSEKYPGRDWEVLQAWKSAGDLLWDANRHDDARKYYARIVERFDRADAPMITKSVVRGSRSRLAE
jgi:TolA-binding protein